MKYRTNGEDRETDWGGGIETYQGMGYIETYWGGIQKQIRGTV